LPYHHTFHISFWSTRRVTYVFCEAFYYYQSKNDIISSQATAKTVIEGQYEIADRMLDFSEKHGVKTIATIAAGMESRKPKVFIAATARCLTKNGAIWRINKRWCQS
jgi:proteasome assembly chaperone (PAC2) family protein